MIFLETRGRGPVVTTNNGVVVGTLTTTGFLGHDLIMYWMSVASSDHELPFLCACCCGC